MAATNLPESFLSEPNPETIATRIDFKKTDLPENSDLYAVLLDNVLTAEECQILLQAAEAQTSGIWERAMVNIGMGRQKQYDDVRKCGRIIWDSHDVVERLWSRVRDHVPEIARLENQARVTGWGSMKRGEVWNLTRLNERMRFLKYEGGEYFRVHEDGVYTTMDGENSYFTLHLYLNDAAPGEAEFAEMTPEEQLMASKWELKGGATTFHSDNMDLRYDVLPRTGRVLIFQHKGLWHSGDDVIQGVKYTMRTDIMYAMESSVDR